jgi:hypothetical protein
MFYILLPLHDVQEPRDREARLQLVRVLTRHAYTAAERAHLLRDLRVQILL